MNLKVHERPTLNHFILRVSQNRIAGLSAQKPLGDLVLVMGQESEQNNLDRGCHGKK